MAPPFLFPSAEQQEQHGGDGGDGDPERRPAHSARGGAACDLGAERAEIEGFVRRGGRGRPRGGGRARPRGRARGRGRGRGRRARGGGGPPPTSPPSPRFTPEAPYGRAP